MACQGSGLNFFYGIHEGEKVDRLDRACEVYDRNVFLVADSLQEFLDGLTTSEELDKRPWAKRT